MTTTLRRAQLTLLAAALSATVTPTAVATANEPGPVVRVRSTIEIVAEGLDAPRGLIYDATRRRVLVAEAGEGGPSQPVGGNCAQTTGGGLLCHGLTGAVLQYSERSQSSRRIVEDLPSIAVYDETGSERLGVIGIHDLNLNRHGGLHAIFGLTGDQPFRTQLGPAAAALGQLARLRDRGGRLQLEADLARYEQRHNPHPSTVESNPYGMDSGPYGTVIADASGNDVLLVKPNGTLQVLAVFPTRAPAASPQEQIESVPTTVVRGPDGAFYVGELTGFPYYQGEARVWRLMPSRAPTVYAGGFTNIADLTFDEHGRLVVLEMAKDGLFLPPDPVTGRLVRIEANGSRTDLATTGLEQPGGVAYAGGGVFYVTNRATGVGNTGQLLRIRIHG